MRMLSIIGILLPLASLAGDFSGKILTRYYRSTVESAQPSKISEMKFLVKGDRIRVDIDGNPAINLPPATMLFDMQERSYILLSEENGQQQALKFDLDALLENPMIRSKMKDAFQNSYTVTSETKEIQGYRCARILVENELVEGELWITKDLGINFDELIPILKVKANLTGPEAYRGFVMEAKMRNIQTGEATRMESIIQSKLLDDSIFRVPAGVSPVDMTKQLQQIQQPQAPEDQ